MKRYTLKAPGHKEEWAKVAQSVREEYGFVKQDDWLAEVFAILGWLIVGAAGAVIAFLVLWMLGYLGVKVGW